MVERSDDELFRLTAAEDTARAHLSEHMAVTAAENQLVDARTVDLLEQQRAAHQRVADARWQLTRACRSGDATRIVDARRLLLDAQRDVDQLFHATMTEMTRLSQGAGLDRLADDWEQLQRAWDADDVVIVKDTVIVHPGGDRGEQ